MLWVGRYRVHKETCDDNLASDFFEQVVVDVATDRIALEIEIDVHVFAKTTRIVVSIRLGISKCLKNAVRLKQDVLNSVKIHDDQSYEVIT